MKKTNFNLLTRVVVGVGLLLPIPALSLTPLSEVEVAPEIKPKVKSTPTPTLKVKRPVRTKAKPSPKRSDKTKPSTSLSHPQKYAQLIRILQKDINLNKVDSFNEGLSAVSRVEGQCGYINTTGQVVIPFKYAQCEDFSQGFAKVRSPNAEPYTNSCGYIDKRGQPLTEFKYSCATKLIRENDMQGFEHGYAILFNVDEYKIINTKGETIIPRFLSSGPSNIRKSLAENGVAIYQTADVSPSNGYINRRYVVINSKGATAFTLNPDHRFRQQQFSDGLLKFTAKNRKMGFIDIQGNIAIQPIFEEVGDFYSGVATFEQDGKYGLINKQGKVIAQPKYDYIHTTNNNGNIPFRIDRKMGVMNSQGAILIEPKYKSIGKPHNDLAAVKTENGLGVLNIASSEFIIQPTSKYRHIEIGDNFIRVNNAKSPYLEGYFDHQGKKVIESRYQSLGLDKVFSSNDKYIPAQNKEYKWGVIDTNGKTLVPFIYDMVYPYVDGYAKVSLENKYGFIDTEGKALSIRY